MSAPTLWFLCPDTDVPSGGVRVIYRAVDHLNAAGVAAFVVHGETGFRCTWFDHATPVAWADHIDPVPGRDVLVLPEVYGPRLAEMAPGVAKVVFNQNAYNTFNGHELPHGTYAYDHPEVLGAVVVSDDNAAYLRYAFPRLDVRRMSNALDASLFFPGDKRPLITFMPRKNGQDVVQVVNLLAARGALDGFELRALHGLSEAEVAEQQRAATMFLSFGYPEGCPVPPKEAMACAALTVGYHGMGGRDYFTPEHGWPVAHGDVVAFARTVEALLAEWRADPARLRAFADRTAIAVGDRYSLANERDSVVDVFTGFLARAGMACATLAA